MSTSQAGTQDDHDIEDSDQTTNVEKVTEEKKSNPVVQLKRSSGTAGSPHGSPSTYLFENKVTTIFAYLFFSYSLATIIAFGIGLSNTNAQIYGNYVYYSAQILYQICIVTISYLSAKNLTEIMPELKQRTATWYELVFYFKFFCCSLFNGISCSLLIVGLITNDNRDHSSEMGPTYYALMAITDFFNIFSIPLPGIIFFRFQYVKKTITSPRSIKSHSFPPKTDAKTSLLSHGSNVVYNSDQDSNNGGGNRTSSTISVISQMSQMNLQKNPFSDKELLTAIACVYFVHFLSYVLFPALYDNEFDDQLSVMYPNVDNHWIYKALYTINHIFLKTFMGMSLNGLFFAFFAMIVARDEERYFTKDDKLSDCELVKQLIQKHWKFVTLLILFTLFGTAFDLAFYFIKSSEILETLSIIKNIFWISINVIGMLVGLYYRYLFKGAHRKYTIPYNDRFGNKEKVDNELDWYRAISMLGFSAVQCFTLTQLRSLQTNDEYYTKWCQKAARERNLKWMYFRFFIFINSVDLVYLYVYSNQYYTIDKLQDSVEKRISYAMAFSGAAIFMISLSQLIISYAEFDQLRNREPMMEMSVSTKSGSNVPIKQGKL